MTRSPTLPPLRWQEDSAERLGLCLLADAIDYLGVSHIVVVGHYDCGAIRASSSNRHHGAPLENWLTPLRDIQRLHKTELMRFSRSGDDRHRRQVELSVIEQCLGVFKTPSVQVRRMQLPRLRPCWADGPFSGETGSASAGLGVIVGPDPGGGG